MTMFEDAELGAGTERAFPQPRHGASSGGERPTTARSSPHAGAGARESAGTGSLAKMSDFFIRTSRASVQVPNERRRELADRLVRSGLAGAAAELDERNSFTPDQKPAVLEVVDAWRDEVRPEDFGPDLEELREALRKDVSSDLLLS